MTLSLNFPPAEIQALAAEIATAIRPFITTTAETERSSMKLLTIEEVAANANVVRKTVENWITSGKLRAACDWGSDNRPMYRVSVAAFWEFYDSNPVLIRKARGRSGSRKR